MADTSGAHCTKAGAERRSPQWCDAICRDVFRGDEGVLCFSSSLLGLIRRYFQCYKSEEGDLMLFRPKKNFDRFKRSAGRLGLPVRTDHLC